MDYLTIIAVIAGGIGGYFGSRLLKSLGKVWKKINKPCCATYNAWTDYKHEYLCPRRRLGDKWHSPLPVNCDHPLEAERLDRSFGGVTCMKCGTHRGGL